MAKRGIVKVIPTTDQVKAGVVAVTLSNGMKARVLLRHGIDSKADEASANMLLQPRLKQALQRAEVALVFGSNEQR